MDHEYVLRHNIRFNNLGYIKAVANLKDKHDRSAPSDYHWKILKCRMIIFSNSSILACPDKFDLKKVHVIFDKMGDNYDKLNSLFLKFSLVQDGPIAVITDELYQMCFEYTLLAKLSPKWNVLGRDYLINNRDFLVVKGPQEGVKYNITCNNECIKIHLKPVKINLIRSDDDFKPGEWVRVLPSLNKAVVEECFATFPDTGVFKTYKEIRRHWKNIHGYRLPEEDALTYCLVRFWRGDPLTYPKICVTRHFPVVAPMPKLEEKDVLIRFTDCVKNKMPQVLGVPLKIQLDNVLEMNNEKILETQTISLCTPTQTRHNHPQCSNTNLNLD